MVNNPALRKKMSVESINAATWPNRSYRVFEDANIFWGWGPRATYDKSTTHPKFDPTRLRTYDLQIMTSHFTPLRHQLKPLCNHQWLLFAQFNKKRLLYKICSPWKDILGNLGREILMPHSVSPGNQDPSGLTVFVMYFTWLCGSHFNL